MKTNATATIITIGDELLIGQVIDTNSAWIAQQLNAEGITILQRTAIADDKQAIISTLKNDLTLADIVIITGGLGPTADDITKPVLAEFFGGKLVMNESVLNHVKEIFRVRNRPFLERNMKQAEVPDVATVLPNAMGTAPGMWFQQGDKVVISLPGVPYEMINIMENVALPKIKARFQGGVVAHLSIITAGEGESFIAHQIEEEEAALPTHIKLAYLPQPGMVRLRLSGTGTDGQQLLAELAIHRAAIAGKLQEVVIALEDLPLEALVGRSLLASNKTIGLAESCTGGYIAHRLTNIIGSGRYFQGGIVAYQKELKETLLHVAPNTIAAHCVVSEEVALEMAAGARKALLSDIGFGITGLLSADDRYSVEVGTVCMAVCDENRSFSKTYSFRMDRPRNKDLAVQHALLMIWKFVNGKL